MFTMTRNAATFQRSQFTRTKWDTAEDKVRFAKQFVRFVQSGFAAQHFTDKFYRRLSNTFGHIAHYNRGGFWAEFFTTTADKLRFLEMTLSHPCYGDPAWTYSDVERALQEWLRACGLPDLYRQKLAEETEAAERDELARLREKYA
jgi:hypothetical protein